MDRESFEQPNDKVKQELVEEIELLIPYLGPPDKVVDNEPSWCGAKWKLAVAAYDKDQGKLEASTN